MNPLIVVGIQQFWVVHHGVWWQNTEQANLGNIHKSSVASLHSEKSLARSMLFYSKNCQQ